MQSRFWLQIRNRPTGGMHFNLYLSTVVNKELSCSTFGRSCFLFCFYVLKKDSDRTHWFKDFMNLFLKVPQLFLLRVKQREYVYRLLMQKLYCHFQPTFSYETFQLIDLCWYTNAFYILVILNVICSIEILLLKTKTLRLEQRDLFLVLKCSRRGHLSFPQWRCKLNNYRYDQSLPKSISIRCPPFLVLMIANESFLDKGRKLMQIVSHLTFLEVLLSCF